MEYLTPPCLSNGRIDQLKLEIGEPLGEEETFFSPYPIGKPPRVRPFIDYQRKSLEKEKKNIIQFLRQLNGGFPRGFPH